MNLFKTRHARRVALSAAASVAALVAVVPVADAAPPNTKETRVTGKLAGWAQAVSNRGTGGAGRFGCRAAKNGEQSCLRSNNVGGGMSFLFASTGDLGGFIRVGTGGDAARPFTTNATGVATGLNADRLDGRHASDFLLAAAKAFDADRLDGLDASEFVRVGQPVGEADTVDGKHASDFVAATSLLSLGADPRLDVGDPASTIGAGGGLTFKAQCTDAAGGLTLELTLANASAGAARFAVMEPVASLTEQVDVEPSDGDAPVLEVSANEIGSDFVAPVPVSVVRSDGSVYSGTISVAVDFGGSDCFVSGVLTAS